MSFRRATKWTAVLGAGALALMACGDSEDETADSSVDIVYTAFDEGVAATFLWKHILEEEGYNVELTLMDPGPAYAGVGQADVDFYLASNEITHRDYVEEYGDGFEFLGVWYEPLRHALAVPDYVYADGIQEISDLQGRGDEFGNQIVGIESGAGITREAGEAIETYGLDDFSLLDSSTAAMLTEFGAAVDSEEYIVATAWNPHWAVGEYNMEFLDDPEGIFADGDTYQVIASETGQQNEEVMSLLSQFEMNDDQLYSLMSEMHDAEEGNEEEAVDAWLENPEYQELIDGWVAAAEIE